jgi:hypothetical protein
MNRDDVLAAALACHADGRLQAELAQRVARPTESQDPARAGELGAYLDESP